jgi:hypothetical protein
MATMPPGLQTRKQLRSDTLWTRREHGAEHADHDIEAVIGEVKIFRVLFFEKNVQRFSRGALPGLSEQVGGNVYADYGGSSARGWNRGIAGAAGYIEDASVPGDANPFDEVFGGFESKAGDAAEIPRRPGAFHSGLHLR